MRINKMEKLKMKDSENRYIFDIFRKAASNNKLEVSMVSEASGVRSKKIFAVIKENLSASKLKMQIRLTEQVSEPSIHGTQHVIYQTGREHGIKITAELRIINQKKLKLPVNYKKSTKPQFLPDYLSEWDYKCLGYKFEGVSLSDEFITFTTINL